MNTDIFALLDAGETTDRLHPRLPTISLWGKGIHYVMFFTLHPDRFASHREEDKRNSYYYLCPGKDCPACLVGDRATEHIYLPVWDPQNRRIAVLRFDTRPDGPARLLLSFLKSYQDQLADVVAVLDCKGDGKGTFTITAHRPLPETDRGVLHCRAFCDGLEAGTIDMRGCVRRLSQEEIMALPSVRRRVTPLIGDPVAPTTPSVTPLSAPVEGLVALDSKPIEAPVTLTLASTGRPMGPPLMTANEPRVTADGGEGA
jgi:hypothetical protein